MVLVGRLPAIEVHRSRFPEFKDADLNENKVSKPGISEPEAWMSREVIELLPEIRELKPFFTPLETIIRVAQKIRNLNDPDLNRHALRTFTIADGNLMHLSWMDDIIGSGFMSGINSLAFFMEMVKDNPDPYIKKHYQLHRIKKVERTIELQHFCYIPLLTNLIETPKILLTTEWKVNYNQSGDIAGGKLLDIDPAIFHLPKLKRCRVAHHEFTEPLWMKKLASMEILYITVSRIPEITIEDCPNLLRIGLGGNACFRISIKKCPKLKVLYVSSSSKRIELDIQDCPSLEEVELEKVIIKDVDFITPASKTLRKFIIEKSNIKKIPTQLKECSKIKTLHI
jgi:hypothetical protein